MHGFHGVTVRAVADECGVDSALVHYYYGTKQELFDAVLARRDGPDQPGPHGRDGAL